MANLLHMKNTNSKFYLAVLGIGICSFLVSVIFGIAVFAICRNPDLIAGNPEMVSSVLLLLRAYGYGIWPGLSVVVIGIGFELRSIRANGCRKETTDRENG